MQPSINIPNTIASIVFIIATTYFLFKHEWVAAYICAIAGSAYIFMVIKSDTNTDPLNRSARYLDWALTTPLTVYIILGLAGFSEREKLIIAGADLAMIFAGWMGTKQPQNMLMWFTVGCLLFLPVFYYLFLVTRKKGHAAVAILTLVVWLIYPIVYIIDRYKLIDKAAIEWFLIILDMTAKVGYGILEAT